MAESVPKDVNPLYNYHNIERLWNGCVRRNRSRHSSTCRQYFNDFISTHRAYEFSITRVFDGTTEVFVDIDMYNRMKEEVEKKTGLTMPDISPLDMSSPSNVVQRKKAFTTQQQFTEFKSSLETENNDVRARARNNALEHSRKLRQILTNHKPETILLAFDLEVHDKDRKTILEVGYVKFTLKEHNQPHYFHAIIEENLHLTNTNVSDNRNKFKYGTSKHMSLKEAAELLQIEIAGTDIVVVHAGTNDTKYLSDNGIHITEKTTFDTQVLALDLLPPIHQCVITWGLKRMLKELSISCDEDILHNAANDAHFTMMAFKALVKKAMPGKRF